MTTAEAVETSVTNSLSPDYNRDDQLPTWADVPMLKPFTLFPWDHVFQTGPPSTLFFCHLYITFAKFSRHFTRKHVEVEN